MSTTNGGLTAKQARFAEEYLVDLNATQAAIRAGYSERSAKAIGHENLTKPDLAARISELVEERNERVRFDADSVLSRLVQMDRADIAELFRADGRPLPLHETPEAARRLIASIEYGQNGVKIRLVDRLRVLELIGGSTLFDSLQCVRRGGIVCMTGILGGQWVIEAFRPMEHIPTGVKLTSYSGSSSDITQEQLQEYVSLVEHGRLKLPLGPTFHFTELQEAHRVMDANSANGKIAVLVD